MAKKLLCILIAGFTLFSLNTSLAQSEAASPLRPASSKVSDLAG